MTVAQKGKICDLFDNNDKVKKELTYYHHTYEQADNYSKHPEQPLIGKERAESQLFQAH